MPAQKFTAQDRDQFGAWFQRTYDAAFSWKTAIAAGMALSALRGFWPMSAVAYTNPQALDVSGNGNHLTQSNTPLWGYTSLVPHVTFDGINQFLSRPDGGAGNWADILGTEIYIAAAQRGLTLGGWFNPTAVAAGQGLLTKGTTVAAASSYELFIQAGAAIFRVSTGAAYVTASRAGATAGAWNFIVGRYIPGTEVKTWIDDQVTTTVAGVPAALPDTATQFTVADFSPGATLPLAGKASMCFLCAAQLSDVMIASLFHHTRAMYGK